MIEVERVAAPLRAETVRVLRAALTRGDYQPGDRLSEKDLCARLRVSRTTLRESLRQLEAERLIELIPGQGPVVAVLSLEEAAQIYEVRGALESLAVRIFTARRDTKNIRRLKSYVAAMEDAINESDTDAFLEVKDEFYALLLKGAGNQILTEQLRALSARITRLRYVSLAKPGRGKKSAAELKRLVDAVERGDADEATRLCEMHVSNAAKAALGR